MKVGDLVRIKQGYASVFANKVGIVVVCGTWSIDVRIFENGLCPRIAKEDCEVISESR